MDIESLKYLSVDQALADVVHLITEIKNNPKYRSSPVVVVGGSYSATMSIWLRQKYPHVVAGAWASSAPVLAHLDFKEYKEVVAQSIALIGGDGCLSAIQQGFAATEELIQKGDLEKLRKMFNLCDDLDLTDKLNAWVLMSDISDIFAAYVQGYR